MTRDYKALYRLVGRDFRLISIIFVCFPLRAHICLGKSDSAHIANGCVHDHGENDDETARALHGDLA